MWLSVAPRPSSSTAQNCFSGRDLNHHKENQQEWPGKRVTLLEVAFSFSLLYTVIMHCQKDKVTPFYRGIVSQDEYFLKAYNNNYVLFVHAQIIFVFLFFSW